MEVKLDFEIPKGYRLLRIGFPKVGEYYLSGDGNSSTRCNIRVIQSSSNFYPVYENIRTVVEPIPIEEVPLEAKDIAPGCAFRKKIWTYGVWVYGEPKLGCVEIDGKEVTFDELKKDWMIKPLGGLWKECSKNKE